MIMTVQAEDNRVMIDSLSTAVVVRIQLKTTASVTSSPETPTTPATAPPECDDENKKIYFIAMIVLASVLGALLLLLLLVPLCLICCRSELISWGEVLRHKLNFEPNQSTKTGLRPQTLHHFKTRHRIAEVYKLTLSQNDMLRQCNL